MRPRMVIAVFVACFVLSGCKTWEWSLSVSVGQKIDGTSVEEKLEIGSAKPTKK
jgi:hypothetical protein